jgi:hypothetical protein
MTQKRLRLCAAWLFTLALVSVTACKENQGQAEAGALVPVATPAAEAGPVQVDITQCAGCTLAAQPAWTFEGIFADPTCTEPLAQLVSSACAVIPAVGPTSITYLDEVGGRKAGETANITLTAQVPAGQHYRKAGTACVKANEAAVDVTPMNCAGQRVCRDATGALVCAGCRTFANGCPDFEETRMYASITDDKIKAAKGGQADSLGRLRQCCAAIAAEGKRLGASPEGGVLIAAAAQCNGLVASAGPSGTAPELSAVRSLLAGRQLPAVCAGL